VSLQNSQSPGSFEKNSRKINTSGPPTVWLVEGERGNEIKEGMDLSWRTPEFENMVDTLGICRMAQQLATESK